MKQIDVLKANLRAGEAIFLLIDPIMGEPIVSHGMDMQGDFSDIQVQRESSWGRPIHAIKLDENIMLPAALQPYLVELNNKEDHWLEASLKLAQEESCTASLLDSSALTYVGGKHCIGGWLQSAHWPEKVTMALASVMTLHAQQSSAGAKKHYLRLADRRVFSWVGHTLGEQRLQAALYPITRWLYLNVTAQVNSVAVHGQRTDLTALYFAADEWKRMESASAHHAVLTCWLHSFVKRSADMFDPWQQHQSRCMEKVSMALEQAKHNAQQWPQALQAEKDLVVYASLSLLYSEHALQQSLRLLMSDDLGQQGLGLHAMREAISEKIKEAEK
ncbi:hypothetical protein [Comamonas sp. NoAH]|uniref:hypothetical protein n=1 Tax=Comamonas halotolerans TaxID=3041496 RepID=UPI0024E0756F|nr:hypothetical protein [Comamonas sp. NoAH]